MTKTLLEIFIENKLDGYRTPSRKGSSRGRPLEFSRKKYMASLYLLTSEKQISIAMEQGLSYGLLRKWKTEESFRTTVRKHCREFADAFIEHVLGAHKERILWRRDLSPSQEDGVNAAAPSRSAFINSGEYSADLIAEIVRTVVSYAQRAEEDESFSEALAVVSAFFSLIYPSIEEKTMKEIVQKAGIDLAALAKGLKLGIIERAKAALMKGDSTEAERSEAYYLLTELEVII